MLNDKEAQGAVVRALSGLRDVRAIEPLTQLLVEADELLQREVKSTIDWIRKHPRSDP
jgi:hypothetical protein